MSLPFQFAMFVIIISAILYLIAFPLFRKIGKAILNFFKNIKNEIKKGDEE